MTNDRLQRWLNSVRHMTDEDLLLYLDGELTAARSRLVKTHLQSCWRCRVRSEKIGHAVTAFVERRHAWTEAAPPPGGWARFEARLARAAEEPVERRFSWPAVLDLRQLWRTPAAAAVVFALAAVLYLNWTPRVSASEVLRRAESTELREIGTALEPVVYQKFEVRRSQGSRTAVGMVEEWSDLRQSRHVRRGGEEVWSDLETVLRKNHMSPGRPLSAAAYHSWSKRLHAKQEALSEARLEDGAEVLSLQTTSHDRPEAGAILAARLVLRRQDWHPVRESLQVHTATGIQEYALTELAFHVVPRTTLDASIFGEPPVLPVTHAPIPRLKSVPAAAPVPPAIPVPDTAEIEVRALGALHRAGACLREPVQMIRDAAGGVVVRGLTENNERKLALLAALEPIPSLRIELKTFEEVAQHQAAQAEAHMAESPMPAQQVQPVTTPLQKRLGGTLSASQVAKLSNQAVTCSEEWVSHAWALKHLYQAFPSERILSLPAGARALLGGMVQDHTTAIAEVVSRCRAALAAVLPAGSQEPEAALADFEWDSDWTQLLKDALTAQRLTYSLFLESSAPEVSVDEALQKLAAAVADLEARAARAQSSAAKLFRPGPESVQADTRRKP